MGRPMVHCELMSKDPAKVADFYAGIFDWKLTRMPQLGYTLVETGAQGGMRGINGGIVNPPDDALPEKTLFYILVDDLSAYRKRIVAAGGRICVDEQKVPGMGKLCLFTDPDGRMMGLWKAKPQ